MNVLGILKSSLKYPIPKFTFHSFLIKVQLYAAISNVTISFNTSGEHSFKINLPLVFGTKILRYRQSSLCLMRLGLKNCKYLSLALGIRLRASVSLEMSGNC